MTDHNAKLDSGMIESHNIEQQTDPRERMYAETFERFSVEHSALLRMILPHVPPDELQTHERDELICKTFAQWLGSHMGQMFLDRCRKRSDRLRLSNALINSVIRIGQRRETTDPLEHGLLHDMAENIAGNFTVGKQKIELTNQIRAAMKIANRHKDFLDVCESSFVTDEAAKATAEAADMSLAYTNADPGAVNGEQS